MRVLLFGMAGAGEAALGGIRRAGAEAVGIVLPARPAPEDSLWAERSGLPQIAPADLAGGDFAAFLDSHPADLFLVATYDRKIPPAVFSRPAHGTFNLHPSLLPRYRGHNPYFWVLRRGESETGVTLHRVIEKFDAGGILLSRRLAISPHETLGSLWRRLGRLSGELAEEFCRRVAGGDRPEEVPQPAGNYPPAPRVRDEDLAFGPSLTRGEADRLVRAANPFYGARLRLGEALLNIWEIRQRDEKIAPGRIQAGGGSQARGASQASGEALLYGLADGAVELTVCEAPGEWIGTGRALASHLSTTG